MWVPEVFFRRGMGMEAIDTFQVSERRWMNICSICKVCLQNIEYLREIALFFPLTLENVLRFHKVHAWSAVMTVVQTHSILAAG